MCPRHAHVRRRSRWRPEAYSVALSPERGTPRWAHYRPVTIPVTPDVTGSTAVATGATGAAAVATGAAAVATGAGTAVATCATAVGTLGALGAAGAVGALELPVPLVVPVWAPPETG